MILQNANMIKFNPLGKYYNFLLGEGVCYKIATGICPLQDKCLEELQIIASERPCRNEHNYCICLASAILNNTLSLNAHRVILYRYKACGHYSFSDGQHRTCVVAHILQKGGFIDFMVDCNEEDGNCPACRQKVNIIIKHKLSKFDRIFKTKKYKELQRLLRENENTLTYFCSY